MILSLDIGLASTGWSLFTEEGVLTKVGCIKTKKGAGKVKVSEDTARRFMELAKELATIVLDNEVGVVVAELPHGGAKSAAAMKSMVGSSAVTASVIALMDVEFIWATPAQVKKAVSGRRDSSKDEIMDVVTKRYPDFTGFPKYKNQLEHICDSVGVFWALEKDIEKIKKG